MMGESGQCAHGQGRLGMTADTELRNRIQGFLKQMADHNLEVKTLRTDGSGRSTEYGVYSTTMGVSTLIETVGSPSELERLILDWEREGWPVSESVGSTGTEDWAGSDWGAGGGSTDDDDDSDDLPIWVSGFVKDGKVTVSGAGDYSSL